MHPALSIIVFTTASGAGFGLLFTLALAVALEDAPTSPGATIAALMLSFALIGAGFVSSAFHLGRPERGWRALGQWRSSWLSREALLAAAVFPLGTAFVADRLANGPSLRATLLAAATALLAAAAVAATGMIYASLKPIRQWRDPRVVPGYLALALATGAPWLAALGGFAGDWRQLHATLALAAVAVTLAIKRAYWRAIDGGAAALTPGDATGLGHLGRVRLLDAPHTADNFIMKEMGFRIARKHAVRLRRVASWGGFALPFALLAIALVLGPSAPRAAGATALLAAFFLIAGTLVERWLFFAEAKHSVILYYGGDAA